MRKIIIAAACISLMCSCAIFHKEKYGCPGSPGDDYRKNKTQDQKVLEGDPKATKAAEKKLKTD